MSGRHWQWDARRLPLSAWVGCDHGVVFGVKVVLTRGETDTAYGGRYVVSLWLGPVYLGAGSIW